MDTRRQRQEQDTSRAQHVPHAKAKPVLGRFYKVEPEWEGSSYSYVRPDRRKEDTETTTTTHKKDTLEQDAYTFPYCGSITLEQHADRVAPGGATGTGFALWSAALAISAYLDAQFENATSAKDMSCLELGAGLGLPSIVLARHGCREVVATDHDPAVLEVLERNIQSNVDAHDHGNVTVERLDWAHPPEPLVQQLAPDLIIASDVVWNATRPVWPDLLKLLNRLRQNYLGRKNKSPRVLMGYTQRRLDMSVEDEHHFFHLIRSFGMHLETLPIPSTTDKDVAVPFCSDNWPLTVIMELTWKEDGGAKVT